MESGEVMEDAAGGSSLISHSLLFCCRTAPRIVGSSVARRAHDRGPERWVDPGLGAGGVAAGGRLRGEVLGSGRDGLTRGGVDRLGERWIGDWARVRAGGFGVARVGACRRFRGISRGCLQEVWRASRGVVLEVGVGLALHEGHFRWGFHRIPFFRSPTLAAPFRKGDTPSSPCDPRGRRPTPLALC